MPTTSESLKKVVNIITPPSASDSKNSDAGAQDSRPSPSASSRNYSPPRRTLHGDDVLFPEPTFSEKFMRYLTIAIYLGGLSSLGFFLSIYYIFFWDSRMPPVYKPTKKPPPVFMKP
ncbi:uncharacterized protein LOC106089659 [Stomoxys calcitrans]|uniref:Uncharacterized protein n=1 Tax=Stomoxys calcitrans TaxID=35570 RepID=A0A1I8P8L4_STOCA|nr:uncharacterized protein LOC106089659 [Stomoxys calcitrans]